GIPTFLLAAFTAQLPLAPALSGLVGPPGAAVFVVLAHLHAGLAAPAFRLPYALRGCLCRSLHPEPLGRLLDLRLDAGEVHPAQSHHDFMAVQGRFPPYAHRYPCRTRPLQMGLTIGTIGLGVVFATSLADNVLRRHRDSGPG